MRPHRQKISRLFKDSAPLAEFLIKKKKQVCEEESEAPVSESDEESMEEESVEEESMEKSESNSDVSKEEMKRYAYKRRRCTTVVMTREVRQRMVQGKAATKETKVTKKFVKRQSGKISLEKLDARTLPRTLVDAIAAMNPSQKNCIASLGFGSLLELKVKSVPLYLGHWIVDNFDFNKVGLKLKNGEMILINEEDVHIALGLQRGAQTIVKSDKPQGLKEWKKKFGKGRIFPKDVVAKIISAEADSFFFKKSFVVLFITTMIESTLNGTVNLDYFDIPVERETIISLNWCKFLLERLIAAKKRWVEKTQTFFKGSILFLVLFYLDRVKYRGKHFPRSIPSFRSWSEKEMTNRQNMEMKDEDGFGTGRVLPRVIIENNNQEVDPQDIMRDIPEIPIVPDCENVKEKMPINARFWAEMKVLTTSISTVVDLAKEAYATGRNGGGDRIREVTNKVVGDGSSRQNTQESDDWVDSDHWKDPDFLAECDNVVKALMKKAELKQFPSNDEPSFDLGISLSPLQSNDHPVPSKKLVESAPSKQNKVQTSKPVEECPLPKEKDKPTTFMEEDTTREENAFTFLILEDAKSAPDKNLQSCFEAQPPPESNVEKNEKEKRVLPKRDVLPGRDFRSPFLQRTISLQGKQSKEVSKIAEWVFKGDKMAIIFQYKGFCLPRKYLKTLKPGSLVAFDVMNGWSYILNMQERPRNRLGPGRFFATCDITLGSVLKTGRYIYKERFKYFRESMDKQRKKFPSEAPLIDADLVFFPILTEGHYYVIRFNLTRYTIHIIDNRRSSGSITKIYGNVPNKLHELLMGYCYEHGWDVIPIKMSNAPIFIVNISWPNKDNDTDCGIYAMRHMETYYGGLANSHWDPRFELNSNKNVNRLRELYCKAFVEEPLNEVRAQNLVEIHRL